MLYARAGVQLMSENLRGEMSVARKEDSSKQIQFSLIDKLADAIMITSSEVLTSHLS